MSHSSINYTNSSFFDFTFLNPFAKTIDGSFFGSRFGFYQFISLIVFTILIIYGFFLFKDISLLINLLVILFLFLMYYSGSCLLVPDKHSRCYLFAWIGIIIVVISGFTLLLEGLGINNNFIKSWNDSIFFIKRKKEQKKQIDLIS